MQALQIEHISKSFNHFKAVDDVSFSLDEGKMFALLGPNGAGKTTTMRMIMNIIVPDMLQNALTGKMTVDEAADDAARRVEELISGF